MVIEKGDNMLTPLDNTIKSVMEFTWPMVVICVLTLSSIRLTGLIKNKNKFVFYKEVLKLFFLIYILCLFQIVTFEDPTLVVGTHHFNLIPFKEILRYKLGSRLFFKNVVGNLIMFVPYGFFASYFTKNRKLSLSFILILFASLSIEFTQLAIGRIFDIDDVLLNIFGGLIGYSIYYFLTKLSDSMPKLFSKTWFLNILSILLVIIFISYVWAVMIR